MTSILKTSCQTLIFFLCLSIFSPYVLAQADRTQTLSISPTLFQMSANPEQTWTSNIRVINVNDYEIVVYPQVVNFASAGESGQGSFIPIFADETQGQTLAEWVKLEDTQLVIPPQQTANVNFTVSVPKNAPPGGHYAAILVGTKPPQSAGKSSQVQTAQFVTSLLFVRVSGDVVEKGTIREFSTEKTINNEPDINFSVRFENTGNVHLQPQGDITITNMWGSDRGFIPINYETHFGNVLPNSIRKFNFTWTGAQSTYDIGRFKAVATLGYGEESKNFTTSTTYFWVIPLKQIFLIVGSFLLIFWFFSVAIKMYIRRMLILAGLDPIPRGQKRSVLQQPTYRSQESVPVKTVIVRRYQTVTEPVRHSVSKFLLDLKASTSVRSKINTFTAYLVQNKMTVLFLSLVLLLLSVGFWFFGENNTKLKPYDVTIVNPDSTVTITSDEIVYKSLPDYILPENSIVVNDVNFSLEIINSSGITGVGATVRKKLEAYGYKISDMQSELDRSDTKTVIIYNPINQVEALALSKALSGALLSGDTSVSAELIKVYVGADNQ